MTHRFRSSRWILDSLLLAIVTLLFSTAAAAQTTKSHPTAAAKDDEPVFHEYRGVQIGWLADDVRKKLGVPANKGAEQDYYVFGDNDRERCQILYDKTGKVTTISVDFMVVGPDVITPQQVFGADFESKPDGSKHKLVRYPKEGYWVSYSRTAGDTPIVSVTIQKM
jgi:hypothetical protein